MDANTIINALRDTRTPFDSASLRQINQAAVDRIRYAERVNAFAFKPGDRVKWDGRHGPQTGSVLRKNQTTLSVRADTGVEWRVGANLLKPACT